MHLNDGQLRASLDQEINEQQAAHLQSCMECQARLEELAARSARSRQAFSILKTNPPATPVSIGRAQLDVMLNRKESQSMSKNGFSRISRPVWVGLVVVAILAISMAFGPVRAIANSFLGLFRVEQVRVVQIDPSNLRGDLASSQSLEAIFAEDVQVTGDSEPQVVADVEQASQMAGIPVKLPPEISGELKLEVKSPMQLTFNINTSRIRAVLDELGRTDIEIPAGVDGAQVTVDMPAVVSATYGECGMESSARRESIDPDDPSTYPVVNCLNLVQMASPTISAPPGVDLQQIGQAYLEFLGMQAEDAARFSQNIDWSTTFVLPLPMDSSEYYEVSINGATGTLIRTTGPAGGNYVLLWVTDGVVYALTGSGESSRALTIANSIK
jgi:hypothetical protein